MPIQEPDITRIKQEAKDSRKPVGKGLPFLDEEPRVISRAETVGVPHEPTHLIREKSPFEDPLEPAEDRRAGILSMTLDEKRDVLELRVSLRHHSDAIILIQELIDTVKSFSKLETL